MKALLTTNGFSPAFEGLSFMDDALRTFDRVWRSPTFGRATASALTGNPDFGVQTNDDGWLLRAEVPGLHADNLEIEADGPRLTVRGRRELEAPEGYRAIRRERSPLAFERSFEFGRGFDADNVKAELKNGVLTVSVPRRPEEKPRTIAIQVG